PRLRHQGALRDVRHRRRGRQRELGHLDHAPDQRHAVPARAAPLQGRQDAVLRPGRAVRQVRRLRVQPAAAAEALEQRQSPALTTKSERESRRRGDALSPRDAAKIGVSAALLLGAGAILVSWLWPQRAAAEQDVTCWLCTESACGKEFTRPVTELARLRQNNP